MVTNQTFRFLRDLAENNDRKWFKENRDAYLAAKAEVLDMVDHLIAEIATFDRPIIEQAPEDCMFRIFRDARFSHNKTPYKTNFGAFISDRGRKISRAGYYVHVEPGACFLAGGLYMPPSAELKAVRKAIDERGDELQKIISKKSFTKLFGDELPGDKLKTAPRDYSVDNPNIGLLRMKSYEIATSVTQKEMLKKDFVQSAGKVFREMKDYVYWLNGALDRYLKPKSIQR